MSKSCLILSTHYFSTRYLAETDILKHLAEYDDIEITLCSISEQDRQYASLFQNSRFEWYHLIHPIPDLKHPPKRSLITRAKGMLHHQLSRTLLKNRAGHLNIYYRFHEIKEFKRHQDKKRMSDNRREIEAKRSAVSDAKYGFPFPRSKFIYRWLYNFYFSLWQHPQIEVHEVFERAKPDLVVCINSQSANLTSYVIEAQRRSIPLLGIVPSWDHPTTSPPLVPNIDPIITVSQMVKDHLVKFHDVSPAKIHVCGWPLMDHYPYIKATSDRDMFLHNLGLSADRRLIVFASYALRWVYYEDDLLQTLVDKIQRDYYGEPVSMIIRPHPLDGHAIRLKKFGELPHIVVEDADKGNLDHLAKLMAHADLVIGPASTMTLDAAAMDTPIINIAFPAKDQETHYESAARWYQWEHYVEVVKTKGITMVETYEELDNAIKLYLADPTHKAAERARLREYLVDPLDGHSAKRVADLIYQNC